MIIATILLSVVIEGISTTVDNFAQLYSGWTIYPPLSAGEGMEQVEQKIKPKENYFGILSSVLFYTQILLLIFLAYSGFKTGQNYKQSE